MTYFNEDFIPNKLPEMEVEYHTPEEIVSSIEEMIPRYLSQHHMSDTPNNRAVAHQAMEAVFA